MRKYLYIFTFLCLVSCSKYELPCEKGSSVKNFVLKYIVPDEYNCIITQFEESGRFTFQIEFVSNIYINNIDPLNEQTANKFIELSRLNNDTSYNKPISTCFQFPCFFNRDLNIDLVCATDYDTIVAGNSLNSFCSIDFESAKEFVKSGYNNDIDNPYYFYSSELNKFNDSTQYLLSSQRLYVFLNKKPVDNEIYRIVIKIYDNSGFAIEKEIPIQKSFVD